MKYLVTQLNGQFVDIEKELCGALEQQNVLDWDIGVVSPDQPNAGDK